VSGTPPPLDAVATGQNPIIVGPMPETVLRAAVANAGTIAPKRGPPAIGRNKLSKRNDIRTLTTEDEERATSA
jgi:hypothetical protein